jgi:surfactin synthase thioesterase subunit
MKKVKLFCFPYAGGSAAIYEKWKRIIHPSIELISIEYSGRGRRFTEPIYTDMEEVVDDIYNIIKYEIDTVPYFFFGHSMGSLISYELSHKIKKSAHREPSHIFFSGKAAPNCKNRDKTLHNLNDVEFKEELFKLEGTPKEILENDDLMNIFLPILRSDFKVVEEYAYKDKLEKLNCDFTILYGSGDNMSLNELCDWQKHTNGRCSYIKFPGGHFFINDYDKEIVDIVNSIIIA